MGIWGRRGDAKNETTVTSGNSTRSFARWLLVSVGVALATAVLIIPYPFDGDQSLFAVFARMMSEGSLLYEDVWDVKQPGILWFFQLAGSWNGFSEVGIHLVEVLVWVGGAAVLASLLRPSLRRSWLAALLVVAGPGVYFLVAGPNELTQIEAIISIPVAGCAILLDPDRHNGSWRSPFGAGLLAGLIGIFKLISLLIPAAIFVVALFARVRRNREPKALLTEFVAPFALGAFLVAAILVSWVWTNDLWDTVWYTWIEYPPMVLEMNPRPVSRLIDSLLIFGASFAVLGVPAVLRTFNRRYNGRSLTWLLLAAVVSGVAVMVLQLWWSYLLFVTVMPLAVLAVQWLDDVVDMGGRRVAIVILGLALVPALYLGVDKAVRLVELVASQSVDEYREFRYAGSRNALNAVEIADGQEIYVIGNPTIMYLSGADQAVPVNGWSPEFWTDDLWRRVAADITNDDFSHLFITDWARDLAAERAPWFETEIGGEFLPAARSDDGQWYLRRP